MLLLALVLAPACKVAEAHTHNLRQLHDEDGRHKRMASLMGDFNYALHGVQDGISGLFSSHPTTTEPAPSRVDDPLEECVENLLALAAFSPADEGMASLQIETFARYRSESVV